MAPLSGTCVNPNILIVSPLWTDIQAQPQTKTPPTLHPHNYEPHVKGFGNCTRHGQEDMLSVYSGVRTQLVAKCLSVSVVLVN